MRAHHCRACGRCVLRMDHHCPWIGACVGYRNHGHFLRFLTYAFLGLASAVAINFSHTVLVIPTYGFSNEISEFWMVAAMVNCAFAFCLMVMVGFLAVYQWSNCLANCTTIEHLEQETVEGKARRLGLPPPQFPYDLGVVRNIKTILGPRVWAWPLPLPSTWQLHGTDGLSYETSTNSPWPPEFPVDLHSNRNASDPGIWRRERFRRGSEGFMIPVEEAGVQYYQESVDELEDERQELMTGREAVRGFSSTPLLIVSHNNNNNINT